MREQVPYIKPQRKCSHGGSADVSAADVRDSIIVGAS